MGKLIPAQASLFETIEEKEARTDKDTRQRLWDRTLSRVSEVTTRVSIVRGFLTLHYDFHSVEVIMARKLQSLGGKCLNELCENHWNVIQAWMKEIKLYKENKSDYIKEHHEEK